MQFHITTFYRKCRNNAFEQHFLCNFSPPILLATFLGDSSTLRTSLALALLRIATKSRLTARMEAVQRVCVSVHVRQPSWQTHN